MEHIGSIFMIEEYAKQETNMKQPATWANRGDVSFETSVEFHRTT
jgi:hypothetical protein